MSGCPYCRSSIDVTDTAGNPWYSCGSNNKFRSMACVDREPLSAQLREAQERIKRLEEAGDALTDYSTPDFEALVENWNKAKEAKL